MNGNEASDRIAVSRGDGTYRVPVDAFGDGICVCERLPPQPDGLRDYRYLAVNPAMQAMFGTRNLVGRTIRESFPGESEAWYDDLDRVLETGEPLRVERRSDPQDMDIEMSVSRVEKGERHVVLAVFRDVTAFKAAQRATVASEERQALLLDLSDALRLLTDAKTIITQATRILGRYMATDRTFIAEIEPDGVNLEVHDEYLSSDAPSLVGRHNFDLFGTFVSRALIHGDTLAVGDISNLAHLTEDERAHYALTGIHAYLLVPLLRGGRLAACLAINHRTARPWSEADKRLARQVAERVWVAVERVRAEAALRESEERFQQFGTSSADALWIRHAETLHLEYASPAIEAIYGVAPEAILGDPRLWAALIVPEDREAALRELEKARDGQAVTHEFRILRASDGAFRWIRDTNFPLLDEQGRIQRVGGITEDVTEAKQATEHQNILLFELQHRVRNILAMIRSVTQRTGDTAADVEDYRDRLDGRMRALAHVQVLLTRAANAGVDLATLVGDEVAAQAEHGSQLTLSGPELVLSPKAAEVLTLAVHELTTNALKYGALADAAGSLSVTWRVAYERDEPWLRLDWRETKMGGVVHPPTRRGFGTELIEERIPYELDGRGNLNFHSEGFACHLTFPLRRGDSILETDAVTLNTTIEGGSLDMAGEADLNGCRVLVVEDDFYLAADTARALRKAGAEVLGPVGKEDQALAMIAEQAVTCALVDLNLGAGLQFRVADALGERGTPFVFVTGYDDVMIPERFRDVVRMRKPTDFRQVVRAVAGMCHAAT